jgi:hypothetical protein
VTHTDLDEWPPPVPRTTEGFNALWDRVGRGEIPDPTPYGMDGDHCPTAWRTGKSPTTGTAPTKARERTIVRDTAGPATPADMTQDEYAAWCDYQRWAIGPLGAAEQWLAGHRLARTDFKAWARRHGIG